MSGLKFLQCLVLSWFPPPLRMSSSGVPKRMLQMFPRTLPLWWVWNSFFFFFGLSITLRQTQILFLSSTLFDVVSSFSVHLNQKMPLEEITECWAQFSAHCFSLGSCSPNLVALAMLGSKYCLQLMRLPKLCWLLYFLAASFHFASQHMLQGKKRCAEIWGHLSELPFSLGCAF